MQQKTLNAYLVIFCYFIRFYLFFGLIFLHKKQYIIKFLNNFAVRFFR